MTVRRKPLLIYSMGTSPSISLVPILMLDKKVKSYCAYGTHKSRSQIIGCKTYQRVIELIIKSPILDLWEIPVGKRKGTDK